MSQSVWELLAQGAVDALNAQTFSPEAEARRGWRIFARQADVTEPTITVVPTSKTITPVSRGIDRNTVTLSIVVSRQHGGASGEEDPVEREDEIAGLAQQVEDYLNDAANAIDITDPETWSAIPTGNVVAEVIQEWLADGVFAVTLGIEYTLFRE